MSDEPFVSIETQLLYRYLKESRPPVNLTIGEKNFVLNDYNMEGGRIFFISSDIENYLAITPEHEINVVGNFYFNGRGMNFETLLIKKRPPYIIFPMYFNKNKSSKNNKYRLGFLIDFMGFNGSAVTENFIFPILGKISEEEKRKRVLSSVQAWIDRINSKNIPMEDYSTIKVFLFYIDENKGILVFYDNYDKFSGISARPEVPGEYTLIFKGRSIRGRLVLKQKVKKPHCLVVEFEHHPFNPEDYRFLFEESKEKKCLDSEMEDFFSGK